MKAEELKEKLEVSYKALEVLLRYPESKRALEALEAKFGGNPLVPGDAYLTHYRLGERSVIDYLRELI